jgi:hypothetical protein
MYQWSSCMHRVYTNEWRGFVSRLVKIDYYCALCLCLFDSPIRGTVVDFIHLKMFL